MLQFSFECLNSQTAVVAKILDSAFAVESYVKSFPHIFSKNSSALLACARTSGGTLVGLCSVDTESWSEPRSLRGACIGSVAVDPSAQGQGVGTALLSWVINELRMRRCQDVIYLFSEENRFYERLGFTAVGRERLFAFERGFAKSPERDDIQLSELRRTTEISQTELRDLWYALERMRLSGESHAGWLKLLQVCTIPDLWVTWISQRTSGQILAGGFVGKGIDFQGVMHNLFASSATALNDFFQSFCKCHKELSSNVLVAPGLWVDCVPQECALRAEQNLCYVLPLRANASSCAHLFNEGQLYPRSLFSS